MWISNNDTCTETRPPGQRSKMNYHHTFFNDTSKREGFSNVIPQYSRFPFKDTFTFFVSNPDPDEDNQFGFKQDNDPGESNPKVMPKPDNRNDDSVKLTNKNLEQSVGADVINDKQEDQKTLKEANKNADVLPAEDLTKEVVDDPNKEYSTKDFYQHHLKSFGNIFKKAKGELQGMLMPESVANALPREKSGSESQLKKLKKIEQAPQVEANLAVKGSPDATMDKGLAKKMKDVGPMSNWPELSNPFEINMGGMLLKNLMFGAMSLGSLTMKLIKGMTKGLISKAMKKKEGILTLREQALALRKHVVKQNQAQYAATAKVLETPSMKHLPSKKVHWSSDENFVLKRSRANRKAIENLPFCDNGLDGSLKQPAIAQKFRFDHPALEFKKPTQWVRLTLIDPPWEVGVGPTSKYQPISKKRILYDAYFKFNEPQQALLGNEKPLGGIQIKWPVFQRGSKQDQIFCNPRPTINQETSKNPGSIAPSAPPQNLGNNDVQGTQNLKPVAPPGPPPRSGMGPPPPGPPQAGMGPPPPGPPPRSGMGPPPPGPPSTFYAAPTTHHTRMKTNFLADISRMVPDFADVFQKISPEALKGRFNEAEDMMGKALKEKNKKLLESDKANKFGNENQPDGSLMKLTGAKKESISQMDKIRAFNEKKLEEIKGTDGKDENIPTNTVEREPVPPSSAELRSDISKMNKLERQNHMFVSDPDPQERDVPLPNGKHHHFQLLVQTDNSTDNQFYDMKGIPEAFKSSSEFSTVHDVPLAYDNPVNDYLNPGVDHLNIDFMHF